MEALAIVLSILVFGLLIASILGLINPAWVRQKSRAKAFLSYFFAAVILVLFAGAIAPNDDSDVSNDTVASNPLPTSRSILDSYPKEDNGVTTRIIQNPSPDEFPDPIDFVVPNSNSPINAVSIYLSAWRKQDWKEMARHTQYSWRAKESDPSNLLSVWFGDVELLGAVVRGVSEDGGGPSENIKDVEVTVYYAHSPLVKTETYKIRVVNEGAWGVNPISSQKMKGQAGISLEAHDVRRALRAEQL